MNQRTEPKDSHDYFGTPPWATRSVLRYLELPATTVAMDPACGRGHMTRPLSEAFNLVLSSDIQDLGFGQVKDFLELGEGDFSGTLFPARPDWIFLNPPFRLAMPFVLHSLQIASRGVAVLVRTNFAEGRRRHSGLFRDAPPNLRLQFVERVVMHKGDPPDPDIPVPTWDRKRQTYVMRKPSTATSYEWMIWDKNSPRPALSSADWLAWPRSEMTRPGDYAVPQPGRALRCA